MYQQLEKEHLWNVYRQKRIAYLKRKKFENSKDDRIYDQYRKAAIRREKKRK